MNATVGRATGRLTKRHEGALTALLIVQCLVLFLVAPLIGHGEIPALYAAELLMLGFGLLLVMLSEGRVSTIFAAVIVAFTMVAASVNLATPSRLVGTATHSGSIVVLLLVVYVVSRAVFTEGPVTGHRLRGAIVLYLTVGLCFSTVYRLIHDLAPGAFSGIPANAPRVEVFGSLIYFSFVTLTSVGYGDIAPVDPFARSTAILEAVIGQLYPATLLARLVTLHLETRRR